MKGIYSIFESIGKFADPLIELWKNNKWKVLGVGLVLIIVIMMSAKR